MRFCILEISHLGKLIAIMISAGVFGGLVNFFSLYSSFPTRTEIEDGNSRRWMLLKSIFSGVAATFLVPLFLQMISSSIISSSEKELNELLIFISFCLIAAILSTRFIDSMSEQILKQVAKIDEKSTETQKQVETIIANTTEQDIPPVSDVLTPETFPAPNNTETNREGTGASDLNENESKETLTHIAGVNDDGEIVNSSSGVVVYNSTFARYSIPKQMILHELLTNRKYVFRTLRSLIKRLNIPAATILLHLNELANDGLVSLQERKSDGETLIALTAHAYGLIQKS